MTKEKPEGSSQELLRDSFEIILMTEVLSPTSAEGIKYAYDPLLSARNKRLLRFDASRLARRRSFEKLVERTNVIYAVARLSCDVSRQEAKLILYAIFKEVTQSYRAGYT